MFNEIDFSKIDITSEPPVKETERKYVSEIIWKYPGRTADVSSA